MYALEVQTVAHKQMCFEGLNVKHCVHGTYRVIKVIIKRKLLAHLLVHHSRAKQTGKGDKNETHMPIYQHCGED